MNEEKKTYWDEWADEAKKTIAVEIGGNYYLAILDKHCDGEFPLFKVTEKLEETPFHGTVKLCGKQFDIKEAK